MGEENIRNNTNIQEPSAVEIDTDEEIVAIPLQAKTRTLIAIGIFITMSVSMFTAGTISVILPSLIAKVGGAEYFGMVFTITTVASVIFAPIAGKLGDMRDKGRMFIIGSAVGAVAQVLTAFMPSMPLVLLMRFIAGGGGVFGTVLGLTLIGLMFPTKQRVKWLGFYGTLNAVCNIAAPILGGALADTIGWEWAFYGMIPLAVIGFTIVAIKLPKLPVMDFGNKFDSKGTVLFAALMMTIIALCQYGGTLFPWASFLTLGLVALIAFLVVLFVLAEKKMGEQAMMPIGLFKYRTYTGSLISVVLLTVTSLSVYMFLPLFMQQTMGQPATISGLPITIQSIVAALLSPFFGQFIAKTGKVKAATTICAILMAGLNFYYFTMGASGPLVGIWIGQIVSGIAATISMTAFHMAVQTTMPSETIGVATAGVQTGQGIGATIGAAVFTAVSLSNPNMSVSLTYVFLAAGIIACIALPFTFLIGSTQKQPEKS